MMKTTALFMDLYFWVGLVLFVLSIAGIFWILKSLQKESEGDEMKEPFSGPSDLESLAKQVNQIEETLSKIESKLNEQNSDQMNEMAGHLKIIVQMLKTVRGGGSESLAEVNGKVEKIYQILSTLSQSEQK